MSRWTRGKSHVVTEQDPTLLWAGGYRGKNFRCYLCGYKFKVGDLWRWQAVQGERNFLVCEACDGPDVVERWLDWVEELRRRAWWFVPREHVCDAR